ncbi:hypothetical protein [Saccharothrix coeruleofusca]|nr:hypothetical protein [Saccharothrix coeruleofusca]MBP2337106.1 hypothetical protein [Saccharothrix coeruleofusca]
MDEGGDTKPVHIREVPSKVVDILQKRADAQGMSLTGYLRQHLIEVASKPTMEEWIESATNRTWGVDRETIVRTIRELRDEVDSE